MWQMLTIVIYLVTALASIVYAYRKLRRPGISGEVRDLVFRRHVVQIVVFIFSYAYFFVSATIDWWKKGNEQFDIHNFFLSVLKVNFALQGLYLPLSRVAEPAFYKLIKKRLQGIIFKIIFPRPEPLNEFQQICVDSLCNRGLVVEDSENEEEIESMNKLNNSGRSFSSGLNPKASMIAAKESFLSLEPSQ